MQTWVEGPELLKTPVGNGGFQPTTFDEGTLARMEFGPASLAMNIGPTEALLIILVTLPVLLLLPLLLYWVFRLGKRKGAAEARQGMR